MRCPRRTALAALALIGVAGCSSDAKPAAGPSTSSVASAVTVAAAFAPTHSVACASDLQTMQLAVDAYLAFNGNGGGDGAVTEAAIVTAGLLRAESTLHDVEADGTIVPSPGSVCAD